jgi:tetratricopeptide (TPR) repeat protein
MLDWLNARKAADIGASLADQFALMSGSAAVAPGSKKAPGESAPSIQELLRRADREVRSLRWNSYKKSRCARSFKQRLIENGVEPEVSSEATTSLRLQLSNLGTAAPDRTVSAVSADDSDSGKIEYLLAQANKSMSEGEHVQAVALYQDLLALQPRHAEGFNNLGIAFYTLHRYQEAEQCYREAVQINPEYAEALCNLGTLRQGNPLEAEQWLRRALKANPLHAQALGKLGLTLASADRQQEAKASFEAALQVEPRHSVALLGLGQIARTEGRFEEAEALIRRALSVDPKMPAAWAALNGLRKMTAADGDWLERAEEIVGSGISLWEEAELRFAIGKYCDDVDDYERAFQNYARANELLKTVAGKYDREAHSRFVDDLIRGHSREAMSDVGNSSDSMRPVFVVGMPRSGTSLAEQIIASHPDAKGAGELPFWLDAARAHQRELRQGILGEPARRKLADEYLQVLNSQNPDALHVVDKTNANCDYLGLLYSVFPKARFVYMRRHPIDTCLSCFFQQFSTGRRFTMDLSDLADYFRIHRRVMEHWCNALPAGRILEVRYEDLVADQEKWTRKMLDFLGLEWNERCLSFHQTARSIATASAWQVRQKIYNRSVGRWHNYEKFIGPLMGLRD